MLSAWHHFTFIVIIIPLVLIIFLPPLISIIATTACLCLFLCACLCQCSCVHVRLFMCLCAYDMSVHLCYALSQVGIPGGDITESEKVFLVAELLKMKCLPVFLEAPIARAAYHGYCKQVRTCYVTLSL